MVPGLLCSRRWQEKVTVPGHLSSRRWQEKVTVTGLLCSSEMAGKSDVTRLSYFTIFSQEKGGIQIRPRLIIVNLRRERCFRSSCLSILSNGNERFQSRLSCVCVLHFKETESFRANCPLYTSLPYKREGKVHVQDICMYSKS